MAHPSGKFIDVLHARARKLERGDSLTPPIVNAAKYALPGDPDHPFPYGRFDNPSWGAVEHAIGVLEEGETVCFPSGMAAVTGAIMACLKPKARVLLPSDGYYTVRLLLDNFLRQHDIDVTEIATTQMEAHDVSGYDLVWLETPSNPGLDVCDIALMAERVHAAGGLLVVDNTSVTPLLQPVLDLGADLAVSSDTKALSGHSDVLFGHVSGRDEALVAKVREWRKLSGSTPGPAEAYLAYRGLMTLEVRLDRMCTNAEALADLFVAHETVQSVRFPGLTSDSSHQTAMKQMTRGGFVIGITFADAAIAERFVDDCPAIFAATSFGGIQTSGERRARWGDDVAEGYVRLSVGCEPTQALIDTIRQTLDQLA